MEQDIDDTVIRPARGGDGVLPSLDEDTVIRPQRRGVPEQQAGAEPLVEPVALVEPPPGPPPVPPPASPGWYRFAVNSHEPIALDRPALIGRRPSLPRVPLVARPRLVRVPSPLQEVSGTHLEIRQKGASVVVTDYRSTNGTVVVLPGSRPRRLRPGESSVVTPGSVIDLGDGNRVEILPAQLTGRSHEAPATNERPTL